MVFVVTPQHKHQLHTFSTIGERRRKMEREREGKRGRYGGRESEREKRRETESVCIWRDNRSKSQIVQLM